MLSLENIVSGYGKKEILKGVSFQISSGEIVAILGGNGAGKSTVLKLIAGIVVPYSGKVMFREEDISGYSPDKIQQSGIGYLRQGGAIFSDLTVQENLLVSTKQKGNKETFRTPEIFFPQLEKSWKKRAGLLSGGEKQMLAIAMILSQEPSLLLLDEPSANLAVSLAESVLQRVGTVVRQTGATIVLVEQNHEIAMRFADRYLILREGTVAEEKVLHTQIACN